MMFNLQNIDTVKDLLRQKQETIAVAESVTAGLLQAVMASAELAMEFFQGGITAYNLGQKSRHLGVDPIQAQRCNCVSDQMAGTMAISASRMFSSEWGIAITGYATPVPESNNNTYAYFAISYKGKIVEHGRIEAERGAALQVQLFYVNTIVSNFLKILQHHVTTGE